MPEENFEQQARNRAEQFSMEPQPGVWQRVEAVIAPKRRRRAAFLWWLLPFCIVGGLCFWLMKDSKVMQKKTLNPVKHFEAQTNLFWNDKAGRNQSSTINQKHEKENAKPNLNTASTQNKKANLLVLNHSKSQEKNDAKQNIGNMIFKSPTQLKTDKNDAKEHDESKQNTVMSFQPKTLILTNENKLKKEKELALEKQPITGSDTMKTNEKKATKTNDSLQLGKDSALAMHNKKTGKNKWQFGLTAEVGASWPGGLFNRKSINASTFSNVTSGFSIGQRVKDGIDFTLGAATHKNVSKKLFFDAQLTYRYQQFNVQSTSLIGFPTALNQDIVKSTANFNFQTANVYMGLGFSLFHAKKISVAAQIGIDNGWLFFMKQKPADSTTNLITGRFHRWQPSLQLGVPVGININNHIRWQFSPFVRWGLRDVRHSYDVFGHPLNSAGIKATYFFK